MDKQKLISCFFDFTGMDLDKLLEGLGIDEKFETQKIQNAVNDFEKYILERHGDNPSYEGIAKFWKENQVSENIFSIILDTKKDYSDFKDSLNYDDYLNQSEKELSIELMDLLYSKLLELITELSNDSKSTILAILKPILDGQNRMEKNIVDRFAKFDEKINEYITKGREENEENFFHENLQQIDSNSESLSLNIIGGFSGGLWNKYEIENFDNSRGYIRKLIIGKKFENIHLNNCMDYLNDYNYILAKLDTLNSNEEEFDRVEEMVIKAKNHIESFDKTLEKIQRCLQLYFNSEIRYTEVVGSTIDFKNLLERMLNRGSLTTEGKKYQFFIDPKDNIYFNVYLSKEEIDFINQHDEKLLIFAQCGGDYVNLGSFNKHTKISIIAEMLLELVDKNNLPAKYYKIGNYLIGEG